MPLFSERYGYIKPSEVIIRERITPEIQNAICSCLDRLENKILTAYQALDKWVWTYFLNRRESDFTDQYGWHKIVSTNFILNEKVAWYLKLDLVEFIVKYVFSYRSRISINYATDFVKDLNSEFARLNFAYRIVDKEIVEISSEEEIVAIEKALVDGTVNVRCHLNEALKLMSQRPIPDSRNSIKESISAVEAFCREKTGENTLGKALSKLENNGVQIPKMLKDAFDKLYAYTNQKDTGIRHALMDAEAAYVPSSDEAMFMLVACSAFLNYLGKKSVRLRG